jgi:signal transduction histidine kinase
MADRGLTEDVGLAERAERNAMQMKAMLDELTEATSLESRGVALRRAACDLRGLVAGVVDRMDDARARRITFEIDDASPHVVLADASRLQRVVANLLTNALKYSAEDAPVNARLARRGNAVEIDVVDRGIGIAPESVKMLFDRYYRTTAGKARASGLGLGLYIARLIVEAHGGRIEVSSEVGEGSTFKVILPSHAASA